MEIKNFTATIEVFKSPQEVFNHITNNVAKCWGGRDLEGDSKKLNDEYIINQSRCPLFKTKIS